MRLMRWGKTSPDKGRFAEEYRVQNNFIIVKERRGLLSFAALLCVFFRNGRDMVGIWIFLIEQFIMKKTESEDSGAKEAEGFGKSWRAMEQMDSRAIMIICCLVVCGGIYGVGGNRRKGDNKNRTGA